MMKAHFPRAISRSIMDTSADPCTDFYRYACGKWIDEHTNENRGFSGLAARNEFNTESIVLDPAVESVNNLYQSCESTLVRDSFSFRNKNAQTRDRQTAMTRKAQSQALPLTGCEGS